MGKATTVGKLVVDRVGTWVRIRLPSGRFLSYPAAHVHKGDLCYMGQNQYTRQWGRVSTYGGKLAENVTQALCRDLLAESLVRCEANNVGAILHVHDEIVSESVDADDLAEIMTGSKWAAGLPLAVATYRADRYHKE